MSAQNTLVAQFSGYLKQASDTVAALAVHEISPIAKAVMLSQLITITAYAEGIKKQLTDEVKQ